MIAQLVLAAALAAMAPAAAGQESPGPLLRIEQARVTGVSPMSPMSGIFAVYRDFDVALPDGRSQRMYVLWMSENQYMPDVGVLCRIGYRREALLPRNLHRPDPAGAADSGIFNVVHELNCGFSPGMPPLLQRGNPSAR